MVSSRFTPKSLNRFLRISLMICLLGVSSAASAEGIRSLTLDQALTIAARQNRDIQKAREYARSVQGRYLEERAAALPQFTLNANAALSHDGSQKVLGTLAPMEQYRRSLEMELSQPLYTWGKIGAAIRAAEVGLKTAEDQLRLYRQAAHRDVATAFYDVLLSKELHRLAGQNLEQKQRHREEAERKYAAGVATDYDVLAASVAVENARPEVIRTENSIRIAKERLRFLLALDVGELEAVGMLIPELQPLHSYDQALSTARERRPELSDLRHRLGISSELVTIARAGDKPRLDLKGGAGWQHLSVSGNREDGESWAVGAYLSWPIFDGFRTKGKVVQAESDLNSQRIEEAKLLDSISLQTRDAVNAVREAEEIVKALGGTVTQADRLLAMAEKGYELGVKIRLEVEDAELNLLQAKSNLARARRDYLAARINLEWAMGVLGEN